MGSHNYIMCVDNSGSTDGSKSYWDKVFTVFENIKPDKLIYWNSEAYVKTNFKVTSEGGTSPQCFIRLLKEENKNYNLIITTDGEIDDSSIAKCEKQITPEFISYIDSIVIYYIGNENNMNIGLNIIFGRTKQVSYHINEQSYERLYDNFDKLNIDEFMSPNFAISLIVRIKTIETIYPNKKTRESKLTDLRGEVCRLYSKLENDSIDPSVDQLEICFKNNNKKDFLDILAKDKLDVEAISRQKSAILNLFDSKLDFNISRIGAATAIAKQDIDVPAEEDAQWNNFEDTITLDKFNLPCLLVQDIDEPQITDNKILKHPFKLLSEPNLIKKIMQLIEPNPIDYTTYQKLSFDSRGYTKSPYTRAMCKGVFLLDTADMKCIKSNCRSISVLFGNEAKVPGNLVLWNLVITYLLYKYKFNGTPYESVIYDEIISYCKRFWAPISFTHQCLLLRRARVEICLWYCVHVAPTVCPNSAKNVLRSPFGLELFEFYLDIFGREEDQYLTDLHTRVKKWAVWNYLLANKHRPDLYLEVKAQYQNYTLHNDQIILLAGKCDTPYKSKCNIVDADAINTLFEKLTNTPTKIDNLDALKVSPACVFEKDVDGLCQDLTHVKINLETCWPLVICPVTKLHWKECMGEYDIRTESFLRVFNAYCCKYKQYPTHHMDLALFFSRRVKYFIVRKRDINDFEYIYSLFKNVMEKYTCEEYINIYQKHTDEKLRLSKE